jgi:hypothetical protein
VKKLTLLLFIILIFNLLFINTTSTQAENAQNDTKIDWINPYYSFNNNPVFGLVYNNVFNKKVFNLKEKKFNETIASKITTFNNIAYFVTDKGNLFMVNLNTLKYNLTQITKTGSPNSHAAVIAKKCNNLILKDGESYINYFKIVNEFNLKLIKRHGPTDDNLGIIATEDNVFFTNSGGPAGQIIRATCDGSILNIWLLANYNFPRTSPVFYDKIVVIQTTFGHFMTRSLNNTIQWDRSLGIVANEPLTINNNYIIVKGKDYKNNPLLVAINLSNGNKIWELSLKSEIISNIVSINDKVIFLLSNNTLISLNVKNSNLINKIQLSKYNIEVIKTDLIYINNILIFSAKKDNNYIIVYYDILTNNFASEKIDSNTGNIIGLSLSNGKLIVAGVNGFEILPIYTRSSLTVKSDPPLNLKIKIDNGTYIINNGSIKINYLLYNEKLINLQIQEEIAVNRTTKLRLINWENVIQSNNNHSVVKLLQWDDITVIAKYDYFLLTRLEINYAFLNYTNNVKVKIKINEEEKAIWEDYIRIAHSKNLKIYAEPIIPINSTDSIIFYKWSDNVTTNERNYEIKSYNFIKLTAYYILSKKAILKIKIVTGNYTGLSKIIENIEADHPIKFENNTAQIILDMYKIINFKVLGSQIYIDDYNRYKFLSWTTDVYSNDTSFQYLVNKNYNEIIITFKYERKFELYINKTILFNNKIISSDLTKIYEEWSDSYLNYTLKIKKVELKDKNTKVEYMDIILPNKIELNNNNDELIISLKLIDKKTIIIIYYKMYKLTKLTLIVNNQIIDKLNINHTQVNLEKINNSSSFYTEKWLYEPITLIIEVPKEMKINEVKTLKFMEFKNHSSNPMITVKMEPGEEIMLEAIYIEDNKEINSQFIIILFLITVLAISIILLIRAFR